MIHGQYSVQYSWGQRACPGSLASLELLGSVYVLGLLVLKVLGLFPPQQKEEDPGVGVTRCSGNGKARSRPCPIVTHCPQPQLGLMAVCVI